jgi:hypothetical protein
MNTHGILIAGFMVLIVPAPARPLSREYTVVPDSLSSVPFGAVITTRECEGWIQFDVWAAVPPGRTVGRLIVGHPGGEGGLASTYVQSEVFAEGRRWEFSINRQALESSQFNVIVFASGGPALDSWHFKLGPLLRESFRPYPFRSFVTKSPEDTTGSDRARLDSAAIYAERYGDYPRVEITRQRLELGPPEERRTFHELEPN